MTHWLSAKIFSYYFQGQIQRSKKRERTYKVGIGMAHSCLCMYSAQHSRGVCRHAPPIQNLDYNMLLRLSETTITNGHRSVTQVIHHMVVSWSPISSESACIWGTVHWEVYSHFLNSYFLNVDKVLFDKVESWQYFVNIDEYCQHWQSGNKSPRQDKVYLRFVNIDKWR